MGSKLKALKRTRTVDTVKDRAHMVEFNVAMLETAIRSWATEGNDVRECCALVVDITDQLGARIMKTIDPVLYARGLETAKPRTTPTSVIAISRSKLAASIKGPQPNVAEMLQSPAKDGYFWVCCIGYGGASLSLRPLGELEEGKGVGDA